MADSISTSVVEWVTSPQPVPYPLAMETMRRRVEAIRAGHASEQVWLLEHPPIYTAGTSAKAQDLAEPDRFETFATGRGGQWTYHGPGQLVAYVMLDLQRRHGQVPPRDTHAYVAGLETWLIAALAAFGVKGFQRVGRVGIWVEDRLGIAGTDAAAAVATPPESKIAAIGVRITRWVTWHGISLNVAPDLQHFSGIVPCGIREHGVTSLRALGNGADLAQARQVLRRTWPLIFGEG